MDAETTLVLYDRVQKRTIRFLFSEIERIEINPHADDLRDCNARIYLSDGSAFLASETEIIERIQPAYSTKNPLIPKDWADQNNLELDQELKRWIVFLKIETRNHLASSTDNS